MAMPLNQQCDELYSIVRELQQELVDLRVRVTILESPVSSFECGICEDTFPLLESTVLGHRSPFGKEDRHLCDECAKSIGLL